MLEAIVAQVYILYVMRLHRRLDCALYLGSTLEKFPLDAASAFVHMAPLRAHGCLINELRGVVSHSEDFEVSDAWSKPGRDMKAKIVHRG